MSLTKIRKSLHRYASQQKAKILQRFFKTGKGEYGEGDKFIGVVVPDTRKVAKLHSNLPLTDCIKLLKSEIHEERLLSLLILIQKFEKADLILKDKIFKVYLANTKYINNWDLVDLSAPNVVGAYLLDKSRNILRSLAKSKSLWERRIAIVSTHFLIRNKQYKDTLKIAEMLLKDNHDLIHKAVGWMLREVGKRELRPLEKFLSKHKKVMPRTMLRYAIERFPESKRKSYLLAKKGNIG